MSFNNSSSFNHLATVRPGTSAWDVMLAEYEIRFNAEVNSPSVKEQVEEADAAAVVGRVNRHEFYTSNEADNARYDCGFWGGHPMVRTKCQAKKKGYFKPWQH